MFWELNAVGTAFTYRELYQPEHIVIASLKTVPPYVKELLTEFNTVVRDNVYPGGSGEQELITYIKHALSWQTISASPHPTVAGSRNSRSTHIQLLIF